MELQKLYVSLMLEMKQYAAGLDDAVGQARSFGDRIKGALGGAVMTAGLAVGTGLAAVGGGVVALGASSVGVATEFQSSMAIMSTAVDPVTLGVETTAEAMGILSDASLAVGSDTALVGVSASTSAEAMTGLYKAGLSTTEIFGDLQGYLAGTAELGGALRASIDLAAASELDMVQASELASITLATFGGHLETEAERAEFINSAMNNFVQTADASVASVGDLQAAFVNVGPSASAMGMGVEDVNVALGILSTRGITGSEAGTALKSMLVNLQRTTPEVTDTLDELGVSLYDAQGVMYSLPEIIGQLETSMAGMTDEQRQQTIVTLAGSYGMNAMNSLLAEGTAGWAAMEEAVAGAATMQETAAARTNTLAGAQEALSGVWESFRIQVGTALIPILTMLAELGSTLLERYGPTLVAVFENIGAGIGRIMEVVSGGQLSELFTVFEDGSSVLGGIFEAFGMGEEKATALATSIINVVTPVRDFIFNNVVPFVQEHGPLLMQILGAVAVAFAAFTIITTVVGWISGLMAAWGALTAAISAAGGVIAFITGILGGPVTIVIGLVAGAIGLLKLAWDNNWGGIQEKTAAAWAVLQPILAAVAEWVGEKVREGIERLRAFWVDTAWPAIQRVVEVVWPVIQRIFKAIGEFITDTLIPTIKTLYEKWTTEWWPTIQTVLENVWTVIEAIFTEIGRWVNDNIVPWIEFLHDKWVNEVWPAIQTALETAWEIIEPIWEAIREWAAETLPPVIEALQGIFEGVMSGISAAVEPVKIVWQGFVDAVTGFWEWIKNKVFTFNISLPDLPSWAVPGSPIPLHTGWQDFADAMPGISRSISDGFGEIAESVEDLSDMLDPMGPVYEGLGGMLDLAGKFSGIAGAFSNRYQKKVLDPMAARLEELTGVIEGNMPLMSDVLGGTFGQIMADWNDPAMFDTVMAQLRLIMGQTTPGSLFHMQVAETRRALIERNELEDEYIRQQERLLALEQARADLDFLKSQLDLINLIRDNKLPADLLAGVQLGLAADPGQLMDIMIMAMETLVRQTSQELNLSSQPQAPTLNSLTPGTERTATYHINSQTINGGQNIYIYDAEESELERLGVLAR